MIRRDWQAHFTFRCGQRVEQAGRRTIQARLAVHGRGRVVHVDVFQQGVYPPEVVRDGLNGRHDLRLRAALPCKTRTLLKLCITLRKMFSQVEELSYVVLIRLLGFPTRTPAGLVRIGITIGLRPVPSAHEERRVEARLGQVHAVRVRRRQLQELGVEVLARPLPGPILLTLRDLHRLPVPAAAFDVPRSQSVPFPPQFGAVGLLLRRSLRRGSRRSPSHPIAATSLQAPPRVPGGWTRARHRSPQP
mmetsp:Transcript_1872/g.8322  ORF Transcript_1872/g.8322 Transcript_1872/m.8322 type:complete len:247 (+) Transcript_1872:465-1205(+)